jgi:hypothetical protein
VGPYSGKLPTHAFGPGLMTHEWLALNARVVHVSSRGLLGGREHLYDTRLYSHTDEAAREKLAELGFCCRIRTKSSKIPLLPISRGGAKGGLVGRGPN